MLNSHPIKKPSQTVKSSRQLGKVDEAYKSLDRSQQTQNLEKTPPHLQQHLERVRYQSRDLEDAIAQFKKALVLNQNDIESHYNLGVCFHKSGQAEAAIKSYQEAISCWEKSANKTLLSYIVDTYSNLGCLLAQQSQFDKAIEFFQAGIAIAPGDTALHNNLGIAWLSVGKPEKAIGSFRRAIELQPELVIARYNLGKAFHRLGLHPSAGDCFEQVIRRQPHHIAAYSDWGLSLTAQGKLAEALICFRNAIALQSEFVERYCDRIPPLAKNDELELAKAACIRFLKALMGRPKLGGDSGPNQLLEIEPLTANQLPIAEISEYLAKTYFHLGNALFEYGGYEQAEHYYQKALQIQPRNVRIYLRLGNCLAKQQRFAAAIAVYYMALAIESNRPDVSSQLQAVLEKQQKLKQASSRTNSLLSLTNQKKKLECQGLDCQRCLERIFKQFDPLDLGQGIYFCSQDTEIAIESPETFVARIPNGRVWVVPQKNAWMICNAIAILDGSNQLLPELSREYPGQLPGCENSPSGNHRFLQLEPEELPPLEQIEGTVAVLSGLSGNVYFHWMVDILPRIEVLHRWGVNLEEIDWFLVNSCQQPFQKETLKALGIPEYKILESDRHPYILAKQLIVPSFPGYLGWISSQGIEFLRQAFFKHFSENSRLCKLVKDPYNPETTLGKPKFYSSAHQSSYPELIYISRHQCSYRRVLNEEETVEVLSNFGFATIVLENLTVEEQIALFAHAKVVVAAHGSGLTNLIFCSPKTKVIELVSPNYIRHYYWAISRQLNLEHYYVIGESFDCHQIRQLMYQNPLTEDILVNLSSLEKMMKIITLPASGKALQFSSSKMNKDRPSVMNPESAAYFQKRAEFYLEQGKLEDAIAACQQALKQQPDFAPAFKILGKISQAQGNLVQAEQWYQKALQIQPEVETAANLGNLYPPEGQSRQALMPYQQSITMRMKEIANRSHGVTPIDPNDLEIYIQGAENFYTQRKYEQAANACQRVLQIKADARAYKLLGNARHGQGRVEEAKNWYAKAIEVDPDFAEAYTNLGTLYAAEQQWQAAIACYQKAIALQPDLASTYRNLARVWTQMGQLAKADECWFKAYSLEPDKATPEEHIQLGDNFLRQNQVTQAIRCYCHAIELNPNLNEAYQHLGIALKLQKKLNEEAVSYRKSAERPANLLGDLFKMVTSALNTKAELPHQGQRSILPAQGHTNSSQLSSTDFAGTTNPQWQPIESRATVPQPFNSTARSVAGTSDPLTPFYLEEERREQDLKIVEIGSSADYSQRELTIDTCLQQAENYCVKKEFDRAITECQRALQIKPDAVAAYKILAKISLVKGHLESAIESYQEVLKIQPRDVETYVIVGNLYAQNKQWFPAISFYQKAIAIQPKLAAAYRNLAKAWTQAGKLEEANSCWYEAYALEPEKVSAEQHFKLGNSLFKQGQFTQAIASYQRAITLNPNLTEAYQNLEIAQKQQGRLDPGMGNFQTTVRLDSSCLLTNQQSADRLEPVIPANSNGNGYKPTVIVEVENAIESRNGHKPTLVVTRYDAEDYIQKAESYYACQQFEEAIAECKRAIEVKPEAAIAYKIAGNATQAMDKANAAWYWYTKALEIDPDFAEVHANLGSLYAQQKQWNKSIISYQKAIEIKPNLVAAYRNLAKVFVQSGQPKEGAECWYQALTFDPNWATAEEHFTLGNTLLEYGQLELATSCYQRAIQLQPKYADAYHNLGEVLSIQGQLEEAIVAYRKAIELNPNYEGSHYSLGKALANQEQREEAIACYQKAIELNSKFAQAYHSLGEILGICGQWDEAIEYYEKTIELKPDIWEAHYSLGDALQEKGEIDEAIDAYQRAIELTEF